MGNLADRLSTLPRSYERETGVRGHCRTSLSTKRHDHYSRCKGRARCPLNSKYRSQNLNDGAAGDAFWHLTSRESNPDSLPSLKSLQHPGAMVAYTRCVSWSGPGFALRYARPLTVLSLHRKPAGHPLVLGRSLGWERGRSASLPYPEGIRQPGARDTAACSPTSLMFTRGGSKPAHLAAGILP